MLVCIVETSHQTDSELNNEFLSSHVQITKCVFEVKCQRQEKG